MRRRLMFPVVLAIDGSIFSGCDSEPSVRNGITVTDKTMIFDVRTGEEYASGQADKAENLDVYGGAISTGSPEEAVKVTGLLVDR